MNTLLNDLKDIEDKKKLLRTQTLQSIDYMINQLQSGKDCNSEASKVSEEFKKFYSAYGKLGKSIEKVSFLLIKEIQV